MNENIRKQYEYAKQLFSSLVAECNRLPNIYRTQLLQEFLQEVLQHKAEEQKRYDIAMMISCLEQIRKQMGE